MAASFIRDNDGPVDASASAQPRLRDHWVIRLFISFWLVLGSISALVATYIGLDAVGLSYVFWIVCGVSVIVAGAWLGGPRVLDVAGRIRDYPRLVEHAAQLEEHAAEQERLTAYASAEANRRFAEGITEGRQQVAGALLAGRTRELPQLTLIVVQEEGLRLIARSRKINEVSPGARFDVVIEATKTKLGTVQVVFVDDDQSSLHLRCVDRTVSEFWSELETRSAADLAPPPGIGLVPYQLAPVESPPSLEEDAT